MTPKLLLDQEPATIDGVRPSRELLEVIQRLVAESKSLRTEVAALEVRVAALEP